MRLVRVPVDPKTHRADVKAMEKAITRNTCLVEFNIRQLSSGIEINF